MNKTSITLIAAVASLTLTGVAQAQSNNTLATPGTASPVKAPSGYGTPGATGSDSGAVAGAGSASAGMHGGTNAGAPAVMPAYGVNNTLATPGTKSPAAQ